IKDYRIRTSGQEIITGGSAFNIKAESLRLGNFTKDDVKNLLLEHTRETGQVFEDEVASYLFDETDGQPWLVNAIAYELTFKMKENRDHEVVLTKVMTEIARNRVILSRATHLDQLADKLSEDRVRRVILPMLQNIESKHNNDDKEYCIDLGLIKNSSRGLVIANNIYREIIPRELTNSRQDDFLMRFSPDWVSDDGSMDTEILFNMFTQFWRENSEIWASNIAGYQEAAPHLVFQAYLQRVANGGGYVFREYGLGRGRTDLMLKWRPSASSGTSSNEQRIVIELKVYSKGVSLKTLKEKALVQTLEYAKKSGSTENHIIIFDRDDQTDWREKLYTETCEFEGESFKIWGV
ncbi:MAG: PD-(D/E)XK nuclease domain-containing protein, partial [Spirochaetota bacterium]|nr:PD-(D/E)XK nuclease domain-containing protein [Spirochaetota bacterium]